jgi:hypothetical protein
MRFLPRSYQPGWDRESVPAAYGKETYEKPLKWLLETCDSIEDWGCGYGYARRFVPQSQYFGVDGSPEAQPYADLICDLQDRVTEVDGLFIRHILEHNLEWRGIMENAMKSFQKRFVLILFTPFSDMTTPLVAGGLHDLAFCRDDLLAYFAGCKVTEEHLMTDTQYREEHIFYVERVPEPVVEESPEEPELVVEPAPEPVVAPRPERKSPFRFISHLKNRSV